MIRVDFGTLLRPVTIIRILAAVVTCATFSLASTNVLQSSEEYWALCMFTWVFCFASTLAVVAAELATLNAKVPAWDDLNAGLALLQGLLCLSAAIVYSVIEVRSHDDRLTMATVISWVAPALYAAEAAWMWLRLHRQTATGLFFFTPPGAAKILELLLACLIFASLDEQHYGGPEVAWCVAVYALGFILVLLVAGLKVARLDTRLPFSVDALAAGCNGLAAVAYVTAAVMWPLFSCKTAASRCDAGSEQNNRQVVVTALTVLSGVVYILDTAYSVLTIFCARDPLS